MTEEKIAALVRSEFAGHVSEQGIIRSPGKFEGQPIYVPYYWSLTLEGCADRNSGPGGEVGVAGFDVTSKDRELFPEIPRNRRTIWLEEDEQGFVHSYH